jgi:hypothetical protein
MSNLKKSLNSRYAEMLKDNLHVKPSNENYDEIIEELNGYLEFVEKWLGKEISYLELIFYLTQLISVFTYKSNRLTALYLYGTFINNEANKLGISSDDLFYIRKLESDSRYSPEIKDQLSILIRQIENRAPTPTYEITRYFKLAYMFKEYLLLKEPKLQQALLYEMYDLRFDWVKMLSLYAPIKGQATAVVLQAFDISDEEHRGWLKKLRVE